MNRPLRDSNPNKIHIITCRTERAELLLVPSPIMNEMIGGVLARYSEAYSIELYAAVFLSNHYHLVAKAPEGLMPRFMECINRELAHRVNRLLGRRGRLWARRYDDQVVLEKEDALEALLYVVTNPVHHSLISHPRHWPGICSYWQLIKEEEKTYKFLHYGKYHAAKLLADASGKLLRREDFETEHTLRFKRLPQYEQMSCEKYRIKFKELINARASSLYRNNLKAGKVVMGRKLVLRQSAKGSFPVEVKKSPRPRCYTKNSQLAIEFKKKEKERWLSYRAASILFRLGELLTKFPDYCFKPPLHHFPRAHSFAPT